MQFTYCDGWFRARKRYTQLWEEKKALKAYQKRTSYTVLLGNPTRPEAFAEFNMDYVGLEYLNAELQVCIAYQFTERTLGRLFCGWIVTHRYEPDSDLVASGTLYRIDTDGSVMAEREDFPSDGTKYRQFGKIDPSIYWTDYPQFGQYEELFIRRPVPEIGGPVTTVNFSRNR